MINFNRVVSGIARGNNCRRLLITLGEAQISDLWPCSLSQGASKLACVRASHRDISASHRDISVLVQLPGQYPVPPGRNCPLIMDA